MVNKFFLWVQIVQNYISVARMAGSENYDFKVFRKDGQNLSGEGPHVNSDLNDFTGGEIDFDFKITRHVHILIAVDQSLIQIKDDSLFIFKAFSLGKINFHMFDIFFIGNFTVMEHSQILNRR